MPVVFSAIQSIAQKFGWIIDLLSAEEDFEIPKHKKQWMSSLKKPYKCYFHSHFVLLFQLASKLSLSLQKMSARVFWIWMAWALEAGTLLRAVISNAFLIAWQSLFSFERGSLVRSSLLKMASPFSIQILCKTMHATVVVLTWDGSLSLSLKITLHRPFSCP